MEKQYIWKTGFFGQADANIVAKEINELEEITAQNIVDKARNEDTELHKCFDWDDSIASEKWRKQQAGMILNNLKVVVAKNVETNEEKSVKAFVTLKRETEYEPIQTVVKDPEKYDILKERAIRQLKSIRTTYEEIVELQDIFNLIDEL